MRTTKMHSVCQGAVQKAWIQQQRPMYEQQEWEDQRQHARTEVRDSPAERAARDVGPAREGNQKKPWESKRPELATLVKLLYSPMNTGMVARDGRQPAHKLDTLCHCTLVQAALSSNEHPQN